MTVLFIKKLSNFIQTLTFFVKVSGININKVWNKKSIKIEIALDSLFIDQI